MNLYAAWCLDATDSADKRTATLAEHLAHIETVLERIAVAGPLKDDSGTIFGSMLVIKAEDEAGARALIEADPYYRAGVWETVDLYPFRAVAGEWIGGKSW